MIRRFPRTQRVGVVAIVATLAAFAGVAESQQPAAGPTTVASDAPLPVNPGTGYVTASDGRPVLTGFGNCMHSTSWVLANSIDPCDQIARVSVPVPVVTYEPKPAPPPPAPVAVAKPEPPRMVIQKVSLSTDVLFEFNKAQLKDEGKRKLDELATQVKDAKVDEISVVGHADRIGSEGYNQKLSEARAQSVKDYLAERGAKTNVITAQGKGKSEPMTGDQCKKLAGKKLIECLQPDRRVEIEVLGSREVATTGAPAAGGTR